GLQGGAQPPPPEHPPPPPACGGGGGGGARGGVFLAAPKKRECFFCPPDRRARSYLHANCAHCHRFGGGGGQVVLEMDFSKPLKEMGILDVPPKQGDFGF